MVVNLTANLMPKIIKSMISNYSKRIRLSISNTDRESGFEIMMEP